MMKQKKGVAVAVVVILIISVLIFGFSLALFWKLKSGITQIEKDFENRAKKEIDNLMQKESVLVAIPISQRKGSVGERISFWTGIQNILTETKMFVIRTSFSQAVEPDGKTRIYGLDKYAVNEKWLKTFVRDSLTINPREIIKTPIIMEIAPAVDSISTKKGYYQFIVCVFTEENEANCDYTQTRNTYDKKVHVIDVIVK